MGMKKMGGQFRNSTWDPILIVSQIFALQCVLYLTLGGWNIVMTFLFGLPRSLDRLFSYHEIHVRDYGGQLGSSTLVDSEENQAVLRFLSHCSPGALASVLELQWQLSWLLLLVGSQRGVFGHHVHVWRVPLHEDRTQSHPSESGT
ncbi:hypothetical protein B566_EDAN007463 [Ephemera danica]|nr:hypothetical protein B566_EDAN007463 [Ephemera danica]